MSVLKTWSKVAFKISVLTKLGIVYTIKSDARWTLVFSVDSVWRVEGSGIGVYLAASPCCVVLWCRMCYHEDVAAKYSEALVSHYHPVWCKMADHYHINQQRVTRNVVSCKSPQHTLTTLTSAFEIVVLYLIVFFSVSRYLRKAVELNCR
jgi:hypothetical protein